MKKYLVFQLTSQQTLGSCAEMKIRDCRKKKKKKQTGVFVVAVKSTFLYHSFV